MLDGWLGFSAGPSLLGRLIDGLIMVAIVACVARCCWGICRPRWREE